MNFIRKFYQITPVFTTIIREKAKLLVKSSGQNELKESSFYIMRALKRTHFCWQKQKGKENSVDPDINFIKNLMISILCNKYTKSS